MKRKRKIRTFVITGKSIFGAILGLLTMVLIALILSATLKFPKISGKNGIRALKLGMDDIKWGLINNKGDIGYNFRDGSSILYNYHGIFGELKIDEVERVEKENVEIQEVASVASEVIEEEFKIEAIDAAKGMTISNMAGISVDANALSEEKINIVIDSKGPQVLIVHTHTTESFTEDGQTSYTRSDSDRSTDSEKNMVAVGRVIKSVLEGEGIEVIHDTTVHDYPSYSGAYTRSKSTVERNLKEYPSLKLVLDVHRDGIVGKNGEKLKVLTNINGKNAAQCMFVVGSNALLPHDNWISNMRLACNLQRYANQNYPGLMRAINLRKERFNQQVGMSAVIIEVGSNGNTLDEAKYGAELMGKTIAAVLKGK